MNTKKIYTIIFSCIAAVIAFGFIWSWYVTKDIRKDTNQALKQEQKVTVSNLVLTESKDAKKYWELYAKNGYYEGDQKKAILSDILGNFYDENENVVLSLRASNGTYNEDNKTIILEGDALAVAKDGSSITADRVVWKGKDEDIVATGNVQINRNNELITKSEKAVFNAALTYFKIEGKSESRIYDNKEGK